MKVAVTESNLERLQISVLFFLEGHLKLVMIHRKLFRYH